MKSSRVPFPTPPRAPEPFFAVQDAETLDACTRWRVCELLARGRSADWVAHNLAENLGAVIAVAESERATIDRLAARPYEWVRIELMRKAFSRWGW